MKMQRHYLTVHYSPWELEDLYTNPRMAEIYGPIFKLHGVVTVVPEIRQPLDIHGSHRIHGTGIFTYIWLIFMVFM